jgi:fluoroquinolone transport system permease protein
MSAFATLVRWDVRLQGRNGFYWVSAFVVVVIGSLLLALPVPARTPAGIWVPALVLINLVITTFFFVSALVLIERDEGSVFALAVSPTHPAAYLGARASTLTTLAAVETVALVLLAFDAPASWSLFLSGTVTTGVIYTSIGAAMVTRYTSINEFLLPSTVVVTGLLVPLLPHLGLEMGLPVLWHPLEPSLILLRASYDGESAGRVIFGILGSVAWATAAFGWAQRRVQGLMHDTRATGGR